MNIMSFDVESNGLHGPAFAVAGVFINEHGHIANQFVGRCPITDSVDPWVNENVLGPMAGIEQTHTSARAMRDDFWKWYMQAKPESDLIVAANPYPVEAQFLLACQADDMQSRSFDHPFPYFDLTSMLYMLGYTTPVRRREFVLSSAGKTIGDPHNPLWDATTTALAALRAVQIAKERA